MAKTQCAEIVYDQLGGNQCTNKGKVQEAGKWWCGIHSSEAKRKRDVKRKARWAEHDARWAAKRIRHEENDRKLGAYDALTESHAELIKALDAEHENRKFTQNGECGGMKHCISCPALAKARAL